MSTKLLTVKAAAELLGVSAALLYGLCEARKIRHERHGLGRGCIRIPAEALEEYRRGVTIEAEQGEPSPPVSKPKLKHLTPG